MNEDARLPTPRITRTVASRQLWNMPFILRFQVSECVSSFPDCSLSCDDFLSVCSCIEVAGSGHPVGDSGEITPGHLMAALHFLGSTTWSDAIKAFQEAAAMQDFRPPSWSVLRRHENALIESGQVLIGLILQMS